jgi:hypothetical protein
MRKNYIIAGISIVALFCVVYIVYNQALSKSKEIEMENNDYEDLAETMEPVIDSAAFDIPIEYEPSHRELAKQVLNDFNSYNATISADQSFSGRFTDESFMLLKEETGEVSITDKDQNTSVFNIKRVVFDFEDTKQYNTNANDVEAYAVRINHFIIIKCKNRNDYDSPYQLCIKDSEGHHPEYKVQVYERDQAIALLKSLQALRDSY